MSLALGADRLVLDKPFPVDARRCLLATAIGGPDPCARREVDGSWRAVRTPDGPASLRVVESASTVQVDAWGPGAAAALDGAPAALGLADRAESFDPGADPVVAELARRRPGLRVARSGRLVEALVPTILGQRVSTGEAARSYRRMVALYGDPAPGPCARLELPPDPVRLAELAPHQLHRHGVDARRAATIIGVCRRAASIDGLLARSAPDGARALASLSGVGDWTISIVRGLAWGDPDAPVLGDLHLPSTVAWVLAGERRADDARMLELLSAFPGHRGRVQRLVAAEGGPPRRAPRARILDIRRF